MGRGAGRPHLTSGSVSARNFAVPFARAKDRPQYLDRLSQIRLLYNNRGLDCTSSRIIYKHIRLG